MTDFAPWLHKFESDADDLKQLQDFATSNSDKWPYWSNKRADYKQVIDSSAADDDTKAALTEALKFYFKSWQQQQQTGLGAKILRGLEAIGLGKFVLAGFGLIFAWILYEFLNRPGFLDSLAKTEQARGLITFFFVLTISAVILLVALGIFWVEKVEDAQKRFQSAKELLAIIIGVLGTILGFYFGTGAGGQLNFALSNVAVSPLSVQASATAKLTGQIVGGSKPYTYSLVFSDPFGRMSEKDLAGMGVKSKTSDNGAVERDITAPKVTEPKVVLFVLTASDAKNASVQSSGMLFLEPKAAAENAKPTTSPATPQ